MKLGVEDANALLRLIGEFHRAATPDELAAVCRHALRQLIPGDLHDIAVLGAAASEEDLYLGTPGGYTAKEKQIALATGFEHPVVAFYAQHGDQGARRISDLTPTDRYKDTSLYQSHSKRLAQQHEIDAILPAVASVGMAGIVVSRASRDFSDRDLVILDYLRGPLGLALSRLLLKQRSARSRNVARSALPQLLRLAFRGLTQREAEVLFWIVEGKRDSEIAQILGISAATATTHVRNLLPKIGVESRLAAAMRAVAALNCPVAVAGWGPP